MANGRPPLLLRHTVRQRHEKRAAPLLPVHHRSGLPYRRVRHPGGTGAQFPEPTEAHRGRRSALGRWGLMPVSPIA